MVKAQDILGKTDPHNHAVATLEHRRRTTLDSIDVSNSKVDDENGNELYVRTATGGFIYTLMVLLTIVAYFGNASFLIYVFWLSR